MNYSLPDNFIKHVDKVIETSNIKDGVDAVMALKSLPFISKESINNFCFKSAEVSLLMSMFDSERIGSKGLANGTANPVDAARIEAYQHFRMRLKFIVRAILSCVEQLGENGIGQMFCNSCVDSYIKPEQVLFWLVG